MPLRVSFVGFRHGHIFGLYELLKSAEKVEVVAACEEDAETRATLDESRVSVTHESFEAMLAEVECDVVACGDYYSVRGERLIAALESGRHVMGDKPLCTRLSELDRIETLARERGLGVGCMLDLVDLAPFQTLRRLVQDGAVGEVHTIHFDGKHPLNFGQRPGWYFEEGKHGGTINDIAIHGIDAVPWLTGRSIVEVTAARAWNARHREHPRFQDGAILMLRLDNDGGVTGDVSYLTPEAQGYGLPSYWRFTMAGSEGVIETSCTADTVTVFSKHEKEARCEPVGEPRRHGYWMDFVSDLSGAPNPDGLDTTRVLRSARVALEAQRAADAGEFPCAV